MATKADNWAYKDVLDTVMVDMNSGCWLWEGGQFPDGYGCVRALTRKVVGAHRASYERHVGPVPEGMHVLHKCDTRACINPAHLFLGTNQDNISDRARKGRTDRNSLRETARKLTDQQVIEIYLDAGTLVSIARKYGINLSTVQRLKKQKTWKHLTGAIQNDPPN